MAEIHTLYKNNTSIYPITHISAVVDDSGNSIAEILPTKVSLLENDSGYITEIPDTIASKEYVESAVTNLDNKITDKLDKLLSGTNIKTINGESVLGEGDISSGGGVPIVDSESSLDPNADVGSLAVVSKEKESSFGEIEIYPEISGSDGSIANESELTKIQSLSFQSLTTLPNAIEAGIMLINEGFSYMSSDAVMLVIFISDGVVGFMYATLSSQEPASFSLWDPTSGYNLETIDLIETMMSGKIWYLFGNMENEVLSDIEIWVLDQVVKFKETGAELYIKRNDWVIFETTKKEKEGKPQINHEASESDVKITPNVFHVWGEMSNLLISLEPETPGIINEYLFLFISGESATTLSFPSYIKWTTDPVILPNKVYLISILNGLGSILLFDL